jgi:hypothetical protein
MFKTWNSADLTSQAVNLQPIRLAGGWRLVLICSERKVLLADCWWLVCSERKVLVADKPNKQADLSSLVGQIFQYMVSNYIAAILFYSLCYLFLGPIVLSNQCCKPLCATIQCVASPVEKAEFMNLVFFSSNCVLARWEMSSSSLEPFWRCYRCLELQCLEQSSPHFSVSIDKNHLAL